MSAAVLSPAAALAAKDWREFVRDRRLTLLSALLALVAALAVLTAYVRVTAYEADRAATVAQDRATWEGQGQRNPHGAAHFASWAFRPLSPMALIEPGATPHAGSAVWMEAHNRNAAQARPVADLAMSYDAGGFSAAWVLQTLAPLIICVVAAASVARERERGTLRLLLASGVRARALPRLKLAALSRIVALLALPVLAAAAAAVLLAGPVEPLRLLLWVAAHALYLAAVAAAAVAVSALAGTAARALVWLAAAWLVATLVVPRAGAAIAAALAPLPTADAFAADVAARMKVGHDPFGKDAEAFARAMARRYGVADPRDLPVSLDGLRLQASEEHGNVVFDQAWGGLARTEERQRAMLRWTALASPVVPLQNLSAALAGTDGAHQRDFQDQAEAHRRRIIKQLNDDMALHGRGQGFDYKAGADLWRQVPDFRYRPPALADALRPALPDLALVALWVAAASALLSHASRRLAREAA